MEIALTPRAQMLLKQLADERPIEQVVEEALEHMAADRAPAGKPMTPAEAVDSIRELRRGSTLGDCTVKELINEGRKY